MVIFGKRAIGILLLAAISLLGWAQAEPKGPRVYVIPVSGMVEPGLAAYVKRALSRVDAESYVLLKMDTFGGRVDSAFEIVESVSSLPRERTAAFVEKRAISAGALIALAAGTLVMKEQTLIGDCAPIIQTGEGQKEAGEKTQTVLRAQFRTLAKRNNYPEVLAEAMVSKEMEVYEIERDGQLEFMDQTAYGDLTPQEKKAVTRKRTVVAQGELLTMDDQEAHRLGFSKGSVRDLEGALSLLGLGEMERITLAETWSERLVRLLQPVLPLLMLIGIGAVYTELKAPGFGVPGMVGIICLGLVFFNQYLVGLAHYTELLILVIGFLLLGVEVFVLPGFGIAGITGLAVIAAGLVLSFQDFVLPDPAMPWEAGLMLRNLGLVMGSFLGALVLAFFLVRFVLPRISSLVKGPYLEASLASARTHSEETGRVRVGDQGIALTPLRPSGKIRIEKVKVDAISQGDFIEAGAPVRVILVARNHVIVGRKEDTP